MERTLATALVYDTEELAPRIVASGRGREAEHILELARAAGVSIVRDESLALLLEPVEPGAWVPEKCWEAVARVLAFVMKIEDGK